MMSQRRGAISLVALLAILVTGLLALSSGAAVAATYSYDGRHQLSGPIHAPSTVPRVAGDVGLRSSAHVRGVRLSDAVSGFAAEDLPAMTIDDAQFGAKIGKHAGDYGLNPADPAARDYLRNLITDIRGNADEVRIGPWNPKGGGGDDYLFFRQGSNVVVTKPDGSFVTILKGGENNGWFQGATPR